MNTVKRTTRFVPEAKDRFRTVATVKLSLNVRRSLKIDFSEGFFFKPFSALQHDTTPALVGSAYPFGLGRGWISSEESPSLGSDYARFSRFKSVRGQNECRTQTPVFITPVQ